MSAAVLTPQTSSHAAFIQRLLTVDEVAEILRWSSDTVIRRFANHPGVVNLGSPEDVRRHKRAYRQLRIPQVVLEKFIQANTLSKSR